MNLKSKNILLIFFLSIFYILIIKLSSVLLDFDKVLYKSMFENLSEKQIKKYFKLKSTLEILNFIIYPLLIFIKSSIISTVIYLGVYFYSKKSITLDQIINTVLKAEFVFVLVPVFKLIWFYFFVDNYDLEDIQIFFPFSVVNIINTNEIDNWLIYPLQTLNLFEVAYWLLLSYYIGKIASPTKNIEENKYPMDFGLKIVASSYGSALLLWVVVVMFFTLNYS
jgi:hypothetical protein